MEFPVSQSDISRKNSDFWNELCGSEFAKSIGVTDSSPKSLKKFDDWYFDFYPYLFDHIPFPNLKSKDILEVGLGYGTVSQRLAESGANYAGLDIAAGPVEMVNHRLKQADLAGFATRGSILEPPFPDQSFDAIVAIGCLHHTGNLRLAIERCWNLLRPGGSLILMVYYSYSYRRFRMTPTITLRHMVKELMGYRGVVGSSADRERAAYDTSSKGDGAPHTDWISTRSLRTLCGKFSGFSAKIENIAQEPPFSNTPRARLLTTHWPAIVGLDLYATATK
jgi:2-polyprenyl-3-methyl-5-hydroxy-6-metoxy-1,4-benzoquinol methylase